MEQIIRGSIVVGVDGSPQANRALVWAAEQAALEDRRLVVAHAPDRMPGQDWLTLWATDADLLADVRRSAADAVLDEARGIVTAMRPDLAVDTVLLDEDPRDALVGASTRAHLVVVGAHGRSPWSRLALGSVSAALTQHASCPVLVVGPEPLTGPDQGVLVGADGTAESLPVIEFAFALASTRGLPLRVVHCFWDIAGELTRGRLVQPDETGLDDLRLVLAESVAGLAEKFPDVQVELQLARGLVDVVLTEEASSHDLVVVGRHHPAALSRLRHGFVTSAVLDRTHGNVAVVPEAAENTHPT